MTVPQDLTPASAGQRPLAPAADWPMASRIAFRFVFTYVLLFLGSFSAFFRPLSFPITAVSQVIWEALVPWVASHILLVPPPPTIL